MPITRPIDTLVLGGGMAGTFAALAAKTPDTTVAIVEPANVLGGQGTAGGVAGFCGDSQRVNAPFARLVETLTQHELIAEYDPLADRRAYDLELCAFFLQEMVATAGVEILFHARALAAQRADGHIASVEVACASDRIEFQPGMVVDATGDCALAHAAGFETIHEGANKQLPMSLYFVLWDTGRPVTPFLPPGCPTWDDDESLPMTTLHVFPSGKVEVKMKVVGFDAADGQSLSRAELHARRQMMGLIYYLQTKGYAGTRLDTHVLASVSRHIGAREGRRIVGEYLLTEEDVTHASTFPDAVAVGTYHLDYHWPDRVERAGTGITTMVEPYHIPLRSLVPKGAANLLVAGRSASGDQMAMSSSCSPTARRLAGASLEKEGWEVFVDRSADRGATWEASDLIARDRSLFTGRGAIQPALWESALGQVHMLVRTTCGRIGRSDSADGGRTWSPLYPTDLPNNNSGLDAARLHDGTLALVCNPVERTRTPLSILLSSDNGQTWPRRLDLETADGEYSYPAIIPTQVGMAITYTWKRERIAFWHGSVEQVPDTD